MEKKPNEKPPKTKINLVDFKVHRMQCKLNEKCLNLTQSATHGVYTICSIPREHKVWQTWTTHDFRCSRPFLLSSDSQHTQTHKSWWKNGLFLSSLLNIRVIRLCASRYANVYGMESLYVGLVVPFPSICRTFSLSVDVRVESNVHTANNRLNLCTFPTLHIYRRACVHFNLFHSVLLYFQWMFCCRQHSVRKRSINIKCVDPAPCTVVPDLFHNGRMYVSVLDV